MSSQVAELVTILEGVERDALSLVKTLEETAAENKELKALCEKFNADFAALTEERDRLRAEAEWSRDLDAAPPGVQLLIALTGKTVTTGMVTVNPTTGERTWWTSGEFVVRPLDIVMWRLCPSPFAT